MPNSTFLQIPNNLEDTVTLRRVLTSIVEQLDTLKGNRGDDKAGSESQLVSTAKDVAELRDDLNSLDKNYLRQDGKTVAKAPISYEREFDLSGLNFCDVNTVDDKVKAVTKGYLKKSTTSAPALLAGDTDPATISAKVDELITLLISAEILS